MLLSLPMFLISTFTTFRSTNFTRLAGFPGTCDTSICSQSATERRLGPGVVSCVSRDQATPKSALNSWQFAYNFARDISSPVPVANHPSLATTVFAPIAATCGKNVSLVGIHPCRSWVNGAGQATNVFTEVIHTATNVDSQTSL